MSQIFDALLRSEAERAGSGPASQTEATELLQRVEQQAASIWTSGAVLNESNAAVDPDRELHFEQRVSAVQAAQVEISNESGLSQNGSPSGHSDILSRVRPISSTSTSEGRLVCLTDKGSPTAEAFRLLGVRLRDLRQTRSLNKLLITSTVPREGKSTVSANLACTLATKTGEKVLLLEGDIRRPGLARIFNLGNMPGACEFLRGERNLTESIYRLEDAGIWILPAGDSLATPLELLQSRRLPVLMDQLASLFDWVIVDSPPVLPLADTSVWARLVDGILLVTRQGVTEKQQLARGVQALDHGKLIGALMNCSTVSTYSSYYYRSSSTPEAVSS